MPDGRTPFDIEAQTIDDARTTRRTPAPRRRPVFAILAVILAAVGYIESGEQAHTSAWFSPSALGLAALVCIGLALAGIGTWPRNRP